MSSLVRSRGVSVLLIQKERERKEVASIGPNEADSTMCHEKDSENCHSSDGFVLKLRNLLSCHYRSNGKLFQ